MKNTNITLESLQNALNDKGWTGRVLYVGKNEQNENCWIVYTTDTNYQCDDDYSKRNCLEDGEHDILASDIEETVEFIMYPVNV